MRQVKLVNQLLICRGLLQGMKVDSMEVFNDSLLEGESVVHVILDQYRDHLKSSEPGRSPSPFSRDQLKEVRLTFNWSNNDWLQNTQLAD
jgi:hypothetical protein